MKRGWLARLAPGALALLAACSAAPGDSGGGTAGGDLTAFPEMDAPGYAVLASQCSRCHAAPRPARHTADEWRRVVRRMQLHRVQRGMAAIADADVKALLDYLARHARRPS